MKAFKKWLMKKENKLHLDRVTADLDRKDIAKVSAEIAWRGALKEMSKEIAKDIMLSIFDRNLLNKKIEQELNNG